MEKLRFLLIFFLASSAMLFAGGGKQQGQASQGNRPATWIADRKIVVQAYLDDIGATLPDNQANSPAYKELKNRTGIDLEVRYTPGQNDMSVMAAQIASGVIPDMIISYLNNSTRPEFSVLLKAAQDGMFADLSPYFATAKAYNRYLEPNYLPNDTRRNIMWRDDLGGKVYLVHLRVEAKDDYLEFDPRRSAVGGPYINETIANALNVDPVKIRTPDDFYNLLVSIKNGNFKDNNGRPVTPLGPKYWGGSYDAIGVCMPGLVWGVSSDYNITPQGQILHEVETEWALRRVEYIRKLLAEGLMDPEFFTMDATRALEYYTNNTGAVMGDTHNFVDLINNRGGWIPINNLNAWNGKSNHVASGKGGYSAWAISANAKNPQEIFAFMDYLTSTEGQLLANYGVEGLTYNLVDGKPRLNAEVTALLNAGERTAMVNRYGFGFGEAGNYFFETVLTNRDNMGYFGEDQPGMSSSNLYARAIAIGTKYPITDIRLVEGMTAVTYLSHESMSTIKAKMDLLNYSEAIQQAIYASSSAEASRILNAFRQQLIAAGLKEFEAYLEGIYRADPKAINFR
jgi:putative aldouronate transport system substrate-binding protein